MPIYLGVDPGNNGGMALILDTGSILSISLNKMTKRDILDWLDNNTLPDSTKPKSCIAMMEQVTGYVARNTNKETGKDYNRGDRSFQFGRSYGQLEMALIAAGFEEGKNYHQVRPQIWQSAFGLKRSKGMSQGAWKNVAKRKAQELYPKHKVTLAIADAILIAEYSRRLSTNTLFAPITSPKVERVDL